MIKYIIIFGGPYFHTNPNKWFLWLHLNSIPSFDGHHLNSPFSIIFNHLSQLSECLHGHRMLCEALLWLIFARCLVPHIVECQQLRSLRAGGVWFDCWEVTRSLLLPPSNPQLPGENAAMCCDILILYSTQQCPEIEIFPNSSNSWLCLKIGYTAQMTSLCLKMMINTD